MVEQPVADSPRLPHQRELFIGLVGAVGTDLQAVSDALHEALEVLDYTVVPIRISTLLHGITKWAGLASTQFEDERIQQHMNAGDELREMIGTDAVALLAVTAIADARDSLTSSPGSTPPRVAYVLNSLKHPSEITALRELYGPGFVLVAAYAPREARITRLASRIAASRNAAQSQAFRQQAEAINQRDEADVEKPFGQNVRDTFPLADAFLDAGDADALRRSAARLIELLFGHPFHTPTRDEYGMYLASAAALRSASLGRQVGAAIATSDGDVVALGTNEVPKAGGGLYWEGDSPDQRDFQLGYDSNDRIKRSVFIDILERLKTASWPDPDGASGLLDTLITQTRADDDPPHMKGAHFLNLIEFGRVVHAEMAALMDAASRGAAVRSATLYSTTFPCHDCAKHIVAAGIRRVVYVEPYPKSLAPDLYLDSIAVDATPSSCEGHVQFRPFVGVAPRRYIDLFTMPARKEKGKRVEWKKAAATVRFPSAVGYLEREKATATEFLKRLVEKGLRYERTKGGERNA